MNSFSKPYLFRASLLAVFVIVMGLALSVVVYQSTEQVKFNAIDVVSHRIPILTSINELMADLSEQERVVYEYYSSQDAEQYLTLSKEVSSAFAMHFTSLLSQKLYKTEIEKVSQGQAEINQLLVLFHQKMQLRENNWDELREILTQVSSVRLKLLPTLYSIEEQTQQLVDEGHQMTLNQMETSHQLVISYGVAIILIAGIVSWYMRQYMLTQVKNTRLAMFSHRNPNPIISVNNVGEVLFSNPACEHLLDCVDLSPSEVNKLLPTNFLSLRHELSLTKDHSLIIEQSLADRILQVSIYWHEEMDAYDIHIKDITDKKLSEQKISYLAFYNQETHLPNQYKFNQDIDYAIEQSKAFTVGVFEIRSFDEKLNTLGVAVTDELIIALTNALANAIPAGIHLYQLSDRQFGLLDPVNTNTLALQQLTKKMTLMAEKALITDSGEFFVELDFGFTISSINIDDRNSLVKNAHVALSIASSDIHENFCLYKPDLIKGLQRNAMLIDKLRFAIAKNELFLVFQPQLNLLTNEVTGIETLVRWKHDNEIISPVDFIPLAEQSGLIVPIGQWILQKACIFAKQLVELGYQDIIVAVNVSPRQFSHPQFCHTVQQVLSEVSLPARNLELEITEGVFMHNEENTLGVLQQLKRLGLHLSIDDFGTGYSSLSYLKRFPIDKLKIDQSFIRESHRNDEDKAIIETIVSLGKSLNLSLIAEGVEEQVHVDFLKQLACDEIQGYWFSKPLLPEQLLAFLAQEGNLFSSNNNNIGGQISIAT
jgi:EAL domain-containing protein (putative c-di-GMP-specific phosphodiesterase class I)/GGDEF domain-containing protein